MHAPPTGLPAGAWRARLALKSAAAVVQTLLKPARGRGCAARRDCPGETRPRKLGLGDEFMPRFPTLCERGDPFGPGSLPASPPTGRAPLDPERVAEGAPRSGTWSARGREAPLAAAAAAEAVVALRPDAERTALWCADAALARTLSGWAVPVPRSPGEALCWSSARGGRPSPASPAGRKAAALAYARAVLSALDLAQDLAPPRGTARRRGPKTGAPRAREPA